MLCKDKYRCRVSGPGSRVVGGLSNDKPGTRYPVPGIRYPVSDIWHSNKISYFRSCSVIN